MKRDNLLIVAASSVVISAFLIILTISQQQTIESLTTELVAQSPLEVEPSPTEALDPFADWQTYTDTNYGFEFKYPQNWATEPSDYPGIRLLSLENFQAKQGNPKAAYGYIYDFDVHIIEDLSQYLDLGIEEITQINADILPKYVSDSRQTIFLGKPAVIAQEFGMTNYYTIYIDNQDHILRISFPDRLISDPLPEVYQQILSTFKFLNQ